MNRNTNQKEQAMNTDWIKPLADQMTRHAAFGAREYCTRHNLKPDWQALAAAVKAEAIKAIPQAIAEAKEALECGMVDIAEKTFAATMTIAGIEAAKQFNPATYDLPRSQPVSAPMPGRHNISRLYR